MSFLLVFCGLILVGTGMSAGLWAPAGLSILIAIALGLIGGWMIGEGAWGC